uniref:Phosphomevalonate kinase n=1 Tax=Cacopsylla melanoneura TaxID=428564 RepID=A0A8D8PYA6_9HEMI
MTLNYPKLILLFSGKRKSGKDFLTDHLFEKIGAEHCTIVRLSTPIKSHWAKVNGLELDKLLGSSQYKENHRAAMIEWSEAERLKDSGIFIRSAITMANANENPIWIVSDMRRQSDFCWFTENYPRVCKTVRVVCDDAVRQERGWVFAAGIDDAETECDLDNVDQSEWSWTIRNNGTLEDIRRELSEIVATVQTCLQ